MSLHAHYGCGGIAPVTWRNFDCSPTLRLQKISLIGSVMRAAGLAKFPENVQYGDIRTGLPLPDSSCDGMFSCHMLEHLSLEDCRRALRSTHKHLKPGGLFRAIVPDLAFIVRAYCQSEDAARAHALVEGLEMYAPSRSYNPRDLLGAAFGNSAHRWHYDFDSLALELKAAGFSSVRRCEYNDSRDPMFRDVEEPDKFVYESGGRRVVFLAVEAVR